MVGGICGWIFSCKNYVSIFFLLFLKVYLYFLDGRMDGWNLACMHGYIYIYIYIYIYKNKYISNIIDNIYWYTIICRYYIWTKCRWFYMYILNMD